MGNIARTLDEQIALLQSRGMEIPDIEKAKEVLLVSVTIVLDFIGFRLKRVVPLISEEITNLIQEQILMMQ